VSARLDFTDRAAVAAWGADVATQLADLVAAAEDATRPLGARELGRRAARRAITESAEKLRGALVYAGLTPERGGDEPPPPASGPRRP
jgi:hypothetical protein